MIGLVLGDTHIGEIIVNKLKLLKKKYTIIDISKKKIFKKNKNTYTLSIGELGKAIKILKKNKCKKIIFAGRVERPNFSKTKFDFKAIYYLPKIIKESKKGDAYIINLIGKIFKKEGLKIISQTFFNPEIVLKKGNYTKTKPISSDYDDFDIGKRVIKNLEIHNAGQGIVVNNGNIVVVENLKGTDSMLDKAKILLKNLRNKNKRNGILLKFPKPNQDLRTDLPTVGIKTINKCAKIGLKGIVVKANQNIFLNKKECIKIANKNKMFIQAI